MFRPDSSGCMSVIIPPSHLLQDLGSLPEEDACRGAPPGAVAAVRPLEVVEAEPGLEVGIDVRHVGVIAVAEGDPVVEMEDRALEALHEGVEVRAPGRDA